MTEKFLLKYFPPAKTAKLMNDISSFAQIDLETLYDAWERFNDLLRRCPHHGLPFLPSNTETNPKEQVHSTTVQNVEGLVEPKQKLELEAIVKNGKVEEGKKEHKSIIKDYKPQVLYPAALKRDRIKEQYGASIDVMPYKLFKQLGLGEPKSTRKSIQLDDKLIRYPRGIIEDVLVKVDKFIFPVDFVVLDMDEDIEVPMSLGRPFLTTTRIVINMNTSELVLRVGMKRLLFKHVIL
ncbi:Retrovirus-related Pol polyprotein from transposon opus [Gossypium australe]|uniref:Retrovirus-related Pol polyprotein from transposon opus n=1 Tax=Gossypium australe TaxID=47621 RepID=A0A5B6UXB9_9ROSI|nr:Retrovirus-related Pol polyprotein from transposon opus [Gossypium australe]